MAPLSPPEESANFTTAKNLLIVLILLFSCGKIYSQDFTVECDSQILVSNNQFTQCKWVDYDNDGDLDVFYCLNKEAGFYEYDNGTGNFSKDLLYTPPSAVLLRRYTLGDYDNDGDIDFLIGNILFNNDGFGVFSQSVLPALEHYSVYGLDFADADNDGDLDLACIITEENANNYYCRILFNVDGVFSDPFYEFRADYYSNCCWVDINQDDQMDLLVHNRDDYTRLYLNENMNFTCIDSFEVYSFLIGELKVTDIDSDFDPDIVASGYIIENDYPSFSVYTPNTYADWLIETGDIDNDGDMDLFNIDNSDPAELFLNDGGTFTSSGITFPTFNYANADWGDYDLDFDLDLAVVFNEGGDSYRLRVYKNNIATPKNTPPSPPSGLSSVVNGNRVYLSWTAGGDPGCSPNSLFYNMRLEKFPSGDIVVPYNSDEASGFLRGSFKGNIGQRLVDTLTGLESGEYRWSVQSIDMGGLGSVFAGIETFSILSASVNSISPSGDQEVSPGSDGSALSVTSSLASHEWGYRTKHAGSFISLGNTTTSYTPNFTEPGEYYIVCKSYNSTDTSYSNEVRISVLYFEENVLSGVSASDFRSAHMVDFDNDDDYDLLVTGDTDDGATTVYENNSNVFTASVDFLPPAMTSTSSTCFDYNNDDSIDILLTGNLTTGDYATLLFKNESGLKFTPVFNFLGAGVKDGYLDHGDIDNDGLQDVIICGVDISNEPITKVFRNTGNDEFVDIEAVIIPVAYGRSDFIDLNNDGYLDIFITGTDISGNPAAKYYYNDKDGNFIPSNASFTDFKNCMTDFGDYNNDGYYDIIVSGRDADYNINCYVYKNTNGSIFEEIIVSNDNSALNSGKWIDFDNDGDLDILLFSDNSIDIYDDKHSPNVIMENEGSDIFTKRLDFSRQMNYQSSSALTVFPYDSDSDADFFQLAYDQASSSYKPVIYDNLSTDVKSTPAIPSGLDFVIAGNDVTLSWIDNTIITDPKVSFNLYIFSATDTIVDPQANLTNGFRKLTEIGDIQGTSWTIKNLGIGSYTWKVQSIDNSLNTSEFSTEDTITVEDYFTTNSQPFIDVYNGGADWGDYDNDGDLDVVIAGSGSGGVQAKIYEHIGIDFEELFTSPLTGFNNLNGVFVEWADINNDNFLDLILFGKDPAGVMTLKIYKNTTLGSLVDEYQYIVPGTSYQSVAYGDIDNDGDVDLVVSPGKILKNNGNFNFSLIDNSSIYFHFTDIVDINNDLNFDIVGISNFGSRFLLNEGSETYSSVFNLIPELQTKGDVRWFDYNNDSYADVVMTGLSGSYYITKVFTNNQDTSFTELNTILKGSTKASVSVGDYENDGDTDFFIRGENTLDFAELYLNNEYTGFKNHEFEFTQNGDRGNSKMGDFDDDGDLDIIVTGERTTSYITTLYENTKDWPNTPPEPPDSLNYIRSGLDVILDWSEAFDAESTDGGLSYNVSVGTTPGGFDIVSPEADIASGRRRVAKIGNAQFNTRYKLANLPVDTYYWSVQAIDQSFMGGIWAPEQSFTLTNINPDFSNNDACLGTNTEFTDLSVAIGVTISHWDWDFDDGTTSTDQNPVHQFGDSGDYQVKLVCSYLDEGVKTAGDSITKTVTVLPIIDASFTASTACLGVPTDFSNTSTMNGLAATTWLWDFNDGTTSSSVGPLTNGYFAAGDYNVKLEVTADNGCIDSVINLVHVAEIPETAVTADAPLNFCAGDSVTFSVAYNSSYDYTWNESGTPISGGSSSEYIARTSGSYTVEVVNPLGSCSKTSTAKVVTAYTAPAAPSIASSEATTFCAGDSTIFSVTDNPDYSYQWLLNGGAVGSDFNEYIAKAPGDYTLEVTNLFGCSVLSTNTVSITVQAVPTIPIVNVSGATTFCDGDDVELSVTNEVGITYQWMDGSTNITGAATDTYLATGSGDYKLKLTNTNLCTSETQTITVIVNDTPSSPTINLSGSTAFCEGDNVLLSVTDDIDLTYQWLLNSGNVGSDLHELTATASGDYSLRTSYSSGCSALSANTISLTVDPIPDVPAVTVNGATTFCDGNNVELTVPLDGSLTYQWINGSTNISGASSNTYIASTSGSYKLQVANSIGCSRQSFPIDIVVNPAPTAPLISYIGVTTFCEGGFLDLSVVENPDYTYQWWQGAGSIGSNQNTYTALGTGTYTVDVTNSFGCKALSTNAVDVTVSLNPSVPLVNISGATDFCAGGSVALSVNNDPALSYQWMNGVVTIDGEISNNITATETGEYKLVLTNSDNCFSETQSVPITALTVPAPPTIILSGPDTFCDGDTVELSVPYNSDYEFQWFRDGSHDTSTGSNIYKATKSGSYSLSVRNSSFCTSTSTNTIDLTVNSLPEHPAVSMNGEREFCSGLTTELSVPEDASLTYQWMEGSSNISGATSNVFVTGTTGEYTLQVTNAAGCSRLSGISDILVLESPVSPTISVSGETTICNGDTTGLSVSNVDGLSYEWLLGGGHVGADMNTYSAISSGTYSLRVRNALNCKTLSTNTIDINVNPTPPIPNVNVTGIAVLCEPNTVGIIADYDPDMSYQWMNGDAIIEDETSSSFTASSTGFYKLAVTNNYACVSYTNGVPVDVSPSPQAPEITTSGPVSFCPNDSVVLSVVDNPEYSYQWWHNGGGGIGSDLNTYTALGSGNYTVEAINSDGCKTLSNEITVTVHENPFKPTIANGGPTDFCDTDSVYLNIAGADPTMNYQWKNGEITLFGEESSEYYARTTGNYSLIVSNSDGCSVETDAIAVNVSTSPPRPTISVLGSLSFCQGSSTELSVTDNTDLTYSWLKDGGAIGDDSNTLSVYETGRYTLEGRSSGGCLTRATDTIDITVNPNPTIPAINMKGQEKFCYGDSVELYVVEDDDLRYQWTKNDLNIAGENSFSLQAKESGVYRLKVLNIHACEILTTDVVIDVSPSPDAPTIALIGEDSFCEGENALLSVVENTELDYKWLFNGGDFSAGTNSIEVASTGTYSLLVSNNDECSTLSTNSVDIVVFKAPDLPVIKLSGPNEFCEGQSLTLTAKEADADSYQWMDAFGPILSETGNSLVIEESGSYYLHVSNTGGCDVETEAIDVLVHFKPAVPKIDSGEYYNNMCLSPDPIELSVTNPEAGVVYQWSIDGEDIPGAVENNYADILDEGKYRVVADNNGCTEESEILTINYGEMPEKPTIITEGPNFWYLACSNDSAASYKWYYNDVEISNANEYIYLAGDQLGKYEVSVSNGDCYNISDPVWIPLGTGIEADPWENLKIYPNPTPGLFTLEMDNSIMGELNIDIINERGAQILNIKFQKETNRFMTQIDLSGQPAAMYIIGLMLEEYRATRSLVVE